MKYNPEMKPSCFLATKIGGAQFWYMLLKPCSCITRAAQSSTRESNEIKQSRKELLVIGYTGQYWSILKLLFWGHILTIKVNNLVLIVGLVRRKAF